MERLGAAAHNSQMNFSKVSQPVARPHSPIHFGSTESVPDTFQTRTPSWPMATRTSERHNVPVRSFSTPVSTTVGPFIARNPFEFKEPGVPNHRRSTALSAGQSAKQLRDTLMDWKAPKPKV